MRNSSNVPAFTTGSTNCNFKPDPVALPDASAMPPPLKILAIQFKYFGDTVMLVPALRAIRQRYPDSELHALVPAEVAPLLEHLPYLTRIWPMPRRRGRAQLRRSWPMVRALRAERFDRSVEFSGNDRCAILSRLCGARERLGIADSGGFVGRRFCFTRRVAPAPRDQHEALRLLSVLSAWEITPPKVLETEIHTDPSLDARAAGILPGGRIVCHIASSQPRKEWPLSRWAALHELAAEAGMDVVFGTGLGHREQALLAEFKRLAPTASTLAAVPDLALYLAVLKRARTFVSGDTGPLHFAAALGVPIVALFGPTPTARWRPLGRRQAVLTASGCICRNTSVCISPTPCLATISPETVFDRMRELVAA